MAILVTGGAGYVGMNVIEALRNLTVLVERLRRGEQITEESLKGTYEPNS